MPNYGKCKNCNKRIIISEIKPFHYCNECGMNFAYPVQKIETWWSKNRGYDKFNKWWKYIVKDRKYIESDILYKIVGDEVYRKLNDELKKMFKKNIDSVLLENYVKSKKKNKSNSIENSNSKRKRSIIDRGGSSKIKEKKKLKQTEIIHIHDFVNNLRNNHMYLQESDYKEFIPGGGYGRDENYERILKEMEYQVFLMKLLKVIEKIGKMLRKLLNIGGGEIYLLIRF